MEGVQQIVEAPRGIYPARLDDKGRLKLPTGFAQYFSLLPEKKLFVTSLDRRTAQVYPIKEWRENEKLLETYMADPKLARRVAFNANDLGSETDLDTQGRVLFSPELRRELGIENQPVKIYCYKGRIEVLTEAIYEERKRQAMAESGPDDVEKLEAAGLK